MKLKQLSLLILILSSISLKAQSNMPAILSMRERAAVVDNWLKIRLETVIPDLMRREKIDMWLIIAREYNEDPVIKTMLPSKWLRARRWTILVLFDKGQVEGVERLAVARYDIGEFFKKSWDKEKQPDQWQRLVEIIKERNPSYALNCREL